MVSSFLVRVFCLFLMVAVASCSGGEAPGPTRPTPPPDPTPTPNPNPNPNPAPGPTPLTAIFIGAGDVADCNNDGGRPAEATAKLLDRFAEGTVFVAGDLAYPSGSHANFRDCYHPRWGRHRNRTRPVPGNHEYETFPGAPGYFDYFGDLAGVRGQGFYSYTLGNWHVIGLNSSLPTTPGSEQWLWLRADLLANRATRCTLAYWHHPRFSSGQNGGGSMIEPWRLLHEAQADVVINGHDHGYERFLAQDPDGRPDPTNGIVQFVAGTGGAPLYPYAGRLIQPNSVLRIAAYGVLRMTLRLDGYSFDFIEADSERIQDTGVGTCH